MQVIARDKKALLEAESGREKRRLEEYMQLGEDRIKANKEELDKNESSLSLEQSLQPYGFIRNFYGNDLSITDYGNRLNFTEVGIIWKIFASESSSGPAAKKKCWRKVQSFMETSSWDHCKLCMRDFSIAHGGFNDITRHIKGPIHQRAYTSAEIQGQIKNIILTLK